VKIDQRDKKQNGPKVIDLQKLMQELVLIK